MSAANKVTEQGSLLDRLQQIKFGGDYSGSVKKEDLIGLIRNLATLLNNGVSIPQALDALMNDTSFKRHRSLIRGLLDTVKTGSSLSSALQSYPNSFPSLIVHQIQVGEKSGTLPATLKRIVDQLENASKIKSFIIKKTTYPAILLVAGVSSITFMLTSVIPAFQKMYEESGATLPGITQLVISASGVAHEYGLVLLGIMSVMAVGLVIAWNNKDTRVLIDRTLLQVPLLGNWLRNLAVLQFTETLGHLLESGFNLVDALPTAAKAVNNRYMRTRLTGLYSAIRRGERFSVALQREEQLFPAVVKQLVVVGERTGRLTEITAEIREHLKAEVEKKTATMMGAVEPLLTTSLAIIIGGILLAVYLPMFDMIGSTHP